MSEPERTTVVFLGGDRDPELALLRSLSHVAVRVAATASAVLDSLKTEDDAVVSVVPLDGQTRRQIADRAALLLLGDFAADDAIVLPRAPLSAPILAVAIQAAVDARLARWVREETGTPEGAAAGFFESAPAEAGVPMEDVVGNLPVGVAVTSLDDRVISSNPEVARLLGGEGAEPGEKGKPLENYPSKGTTILRLMTAAGPGKTRRVLKKEKLLQRDDGSMAVAEVQAALLRDKQGQPVGVVRTLVDVTERKATEEKLTVDVAFHKRAEAEVRLALDSLRHVLEQMPVGVVVCESPLGNQIIANERFREMFGGEVRSGAIADLVREDGRLLAPEEQPLVVALARGEADARDDVWLERPSRPRIPLSMRAAPVTYRGTPAAILAVQDLTRLREQEGARRAAERRHEALFAQAHDAIFVGKDGWRRTVEANGAAEKLLRYPREEILSRGGLALAPERQPSGLPSQAYLEEQLARARRTGLARFPWRAQRNGGGVLDLEVTVQPLHERGGDELLVIQARDVTHERILEDELRQSQKLEAIGLLAGGVAHDFNNLLTAVIGFAELAQDRSAAEGGSAATLKFLAETKRAAEKGVDLTRQLLSFSRRSRSSPKPMELNSAVERTVGMLRRLIGETVVLDLELCKQGCPVLGDLSEIEQVLVNLAINARDAMPAGGTLRIETQRRPPESASEGAGGVVDREHVALMISDTGVGMTDSVKSRLFEPFFTTKERGRGTGLGLAVVHGIIQRHSGRILVDSLPGQGTRITVLLPLHDAPLPPPVPASPPGAPERGTESVLVVDDDSMVRDVTASMLGALGYRVSKAASAAEALKKLETGPFDLVVTDVVMPETSGIELARRLKKERPGLAVLLVSGYSGEAFAVEGAPLITSPSDRDLDILQKPLTLEVLARRVRKALGRARPNPPHA